MKQKNYFYKSLIFTAIWIFFFVGLGTFATDRAFREDPEILKKMAGHLGAKITTDHLFGVTFGDSIENVDLGQELNSWKLKAPNRMLELKIVNADLDISTSATEEISIQATGVMAGADGSKLLNVRMDGENLELSTPDNVEIDNLKIQIQIPQSFHSKMSLKTVKGNVILKDLNLASLEIRTVSGDLKLQDVVAVQSEIKTVSAQVQIENEKQGNFNIVTVSGDIELKLGSAADTKFEVKTLSGGLKNDFGQSPTGEYKVSIKTTSGNVQIGQLNPE